MGLNLPELSLLVSPVSIPKTISEILREVSMARDGSEKKTKIDDYVKQLEDEMKKIDAFKRELPLCMLLLKDAIVRLKEEEMHFTESMNQPVVEEFIPLKDNSDQDGGVKKGSDCNEKKNWMKTAQLWSTDTNYDNNKKQNSASEQQPRNEEKNGSITENPLLQPCKKRNREGGFMPFKGNFSFPVTVTEGGKEMFPVPDLSLMPPAAEAGSANMNSKSRGGGGSRAGSGSCLLIEQTKVQSKTQQQQQQAFRKQRRCWSPELHRRFVNALQQLGGTQVATPKQIRELMQVDGLTNDEVKSHLQKYRLHVRRLPAGANNNGSRMGQQLDQCDQDLSKAINNSQSGSPQGPLHVAGSANKAISTTGGDSMEEEEDEKSEGRSWKGRLHKVGEYDV